MQSISVRTSDGNNSGPFQSIGQAIVWSIGYTQGFERGRTIDAEVLVTSNTPFRHDANGLPVYHKVFAFVSWEKHICNCGMCEVSGAGFARVRLNATEVKSPTGYKRYEVQVTGCGTVFASDSLESASIAYDARRMDANAQGQTIMLWDNLTSNAMRDNY